MTFEEFKIWFNNLTIYDEIPEDLLKKLRDTKITNKELEKYLSKIDDPYIECELIEKRIYFLKYKEIN